MAARAAISCHARNHEGGLGWHVLEGINQIVNHGYPSSPPAAGLPGWTFYASSVINHNNTWWRHYPHLTRYIRRAGALLRQGIAVNPVAVYIPLADVYAKFGCGSLNIDEVLQHHLGLQLFLSIRRAGYDFDVLNDHALTDVVKVEGGRLRAGTAEYRAIIVPECKYMLPETLARLAEFARLPCRARCRPQVCSDLSASYHTNIGLSGCDTTLVF
jgi:hypothetical protein